MRIQLRTAGSAQLSAVSVGPREDLYFWFVTQEGYGDVNF